MRAADLPYPLPERGAPIRVAFVGQRTYFEACSMSAPASSVHPSFIDFRGGAQTGPLLDALRRVDPHVVVAFRPEILPPGTFDGVRAPVLGFITEPLPRPGRENHPNLEYNLSELRKVDRGNVDRVICFDPYGWETVAGLLPLWRAMPLPVDDRLYRTPRPSRRPPRVIFIGYSTMHREQSLLGLKHEFDLRHYAHALMGEELREVLADADAGLNVHGERWVHSFENRVLLHLAAGHLVFTETLEPPYGLEPGIDVIEVDGPDELDLRVHQLHQMPDMYDRVRIRGHHKARQFRASAVWPRVIGDLLADLAAFGTERVLPAAP
ncbi:hypothetical protein [Baekduia soli]|uniref:hypothetical protein n=1 Tax=Baekduia soli TaxID=496014 RepID=UPI001652207C|nr:hypothetical protein [Baekduia soli]